MWLLPFLLPGLEATFLTDERRFHDHNMKAQPAEGSLGRFGAVHACAYVSGTKPGRVLPAKVHDLPDLLFMNHSLKSAGVFNVIPERTCNVQEGEIWI